MDCAETKASPSWSRGFEPLDILAIHCDAAAATESGEAKVENQYKRVVPWEGNRAALRAMDEVFELRPYFEWRGLGFISQSALRIREILTREWDAERRFDVPGIRVTDPKAAQCGEVLKGVLKPPQCKLFGRECTPEHPVGALDGVLRRFLRSVLQLRTPQAGHGASISWRRRSGAIRRRVRKSLPARSGSANRRSKWRTAPAAKQAGD